MRLPSVVPRHVEGDVGSQRRLAHGRAAGEDQQVGLVKTAELLVQVDQPCGHPRQTAVVGKGLRRHLHGALQGVGEALEAGGGAAGLGQGVELLFGLLDLLAGFGLGVLHRRLGHLARDAQHLAAQRQVVDDAGVIGGVGRRRRTVHQVVEVAQTAQVLERRIAPEPFHQADGLGQLALANGLLHGAEQALVERLVEVATLQPIAQPLIGRVVEQDRAQERLFGFEIVGRGRNGLARRRTRKAESGDVHRHSYSLRLRHIRGLVSRSSRLSPFIALLWKGGVQCGRTLHLRHSLGEYGRRPGGGRAEQGTRIEAFSALPRDPSIGFAATSPFAMRRKVSVTAPPRRRHRRSAAIRARRTGRFRSCRRRTAGRRPCGSP